MTSLGSDIRLGTTTYSFNDEYYTYQYSLEDLFEKTGSLGPGQGIELIGPQCIRTFPQVSDDFERFFKDMLERYDLRPSAFGHYSDLSRISGRDLTIDEMVDYSRIQLEGAHRLGFTLARLSYYPGYLQDDWSEALYRLLLKDAERLNVRMAMEIHCPYNIEHPDQQRVIEDVARLDSPFVGFTIDCGTMASAVSPVCIRKFTDQGVSPDLIDRLVDMWTEQRPEAELRAEAEAMGGGELGRLLAHEIQLYFGHGQPQAMLDIMPYILHVHGKFFAMDEDGRDPAVRYPEIVSVLKEGRYRGWISSEYEGHHWLKGLGALDQLKAHQKMLGTLFNEKQ